MIHVKKTILKYIKWKRDNFNEPIIFKINSSQHFYGHLLDYRTIGLLASPLRPPQSHMCLLDDFEGWISNMESPDYIYLYIYESLFFLENGIISNNKTIVISIMNSLSPKYSDIRKWSPVLKIWTQQFTCLKIKSQNWKDLNERIDWVS